MDAARGIPDWFTRFKATAHLYRANRGNIAAVLVVLDRLRHEPALRDGLTSIVRQVEHDLWRGWAALSLVVTQGEGQIAGISEDRVSSILHEFGIAARYIGRDGGRSSRGNFKPVRQLLGLISADALVAPDVAVAIRAAQGALIDEFVLPELSDNRIEVELNPSAAPETVIGKVLAQAHLVRASGGVAQHLVGAKLARRFAPEPIENYSAFASDRQSNRAGDFLHGHQAFHVTVVPRPSAGLRRRLSDNIARQLQATILVTRGATTAYQSIATEFGVRLRSIEEYVGDNLLEMGSHDRGRTHEELLKLFITYNERVRAVERGNSGLEIKVTGT